MQATVPQTHSHPTNTRTHTHVHTCTPTQQAHKSKYAVTLQTHGPRNHILYIVLAIYLRQYARRNSQLGGRELGVFVRTVPHVLQQQQQQQDTPAGIVFAGNDICPGLNREMCTEIFSHWYLIPLSLFSVDFSFRQRYCKAGICPTSCADSAHSFRHLAWMSPFLRSLQLPSIAIGP